jgi:two-component system cell cycle response regulator
MDFWTKTPPDLIMISLTLPDDAAFTLFRLIRGNTKTKYTPVFGLVVKTEAGPLQQAQTVGFTTVITKPIDVSELESKIAKAMNLDTSLRYFKQESEILVMRLPENCTPAVLAEITTYLKPKLAEAVDAGNNKAVIDVHPLKSVHMGVIKILMLAMQTCRELGVQFSLVGNTQLIAECKGFEDTRNWVFHDTLENAKASVGGAKAPSVAAPAPAMASA